MKKLIFFVFAVLSISFASHAQENTQEQNQANGSDQGFLGESWESIQKFSYGFLKQGVNTTVGIGGELLALPNNLIRAIEETADAITISSPGQTIKFSGQTIYYFGVYSLETIGETLETIYKNYTSGDPEKIGEASFEIFLTAATIKGGIRGGKAASKAGVNMANKYGPKYHYTLAEYGESIRTSGINISKESGKAFATYDGNLSGMEAQSRLALNKQPTVRITIDRSVKPQEIGTVDPKYGQPGGGIEQVFYENIPANKILSIDPIPEYPSVATIVTRWVGETSNQIASYTTSVGGPLITERNALTNKNEGGHIIEARISTIVFVEESVEPGKTIIFDVDGIFFIGINSTDIEKITPEFLSNISGGIPQDIEPSQKNRNRQDVVPANTHQHRGL